jgi:hypothetical protein
VVAEDKRRKFFSSKKPDSAFFVPLPLVIVKVIKKSSIIPHNTYKSI